MSGLALLKSANDQALQPALSRLAEPRRGIAETEELQKLALPGSWVQLGLVQGPNEHARDYFPVGAGSSWCMWHLEPDSVPERGFPLGPGNDEKIQEKTGICRLQELGSELDRNKMSELGHPYAPYPCALPNPTREDLRIFLLGAGELGVPEPCVSHSSLALGHLK